MAITLTELLVVLGGDSSDLDKDLDDAGNTTRNWATALGGTVTKAVGGAIVGGAAAAATGIAAIGVAAFNVSRDTEQAANDIAASLGVPIDEAERFAQVARRVYGNNFADSIGKAGDAVALITQQIGDLSDADLQKVTEGAFKLKDTFDIGVSESVDAAKTLMENFGVSADEAFDLIAAGQQAGLNRSGDFLDTIGEYSTQFSEGGASAEEFFNFLQSGLQGGVLGTDKAADAFKEFRLRINSDADDVNEALDGLEGTIDSGFLKKLRDGSADSVEAFELVIQGLGKIEDPVERMQIGSALLGTQFEDLGDSAVAGLSFAGDSFSDVEGRVDDLTVKYESFGEFAQGLWRRAAVAISPLTDRLLNLANSAMPSIEAAFVVFEENAVPAIDAVIAAIGTLIKNVSGVGEFISNLFTGSSLSKNVDASVGSLNIFSDWFNDNLPRARQIVTRVLGAIEKFWEDWGETIQGIVSGLFDNILLVIDTTIKTVLDVITLGLQLLNGEWEAAGETLERIITRIWETINTIFQNAINAIIALITNVDWLQLGQDIVDGIKSGVNAAKEALLMAVTVLKDGFVNIIKGIDLKETGKNIVAGLRTGFTESWNSFVEWFKNAAASLTSFIPDFSSLNPFSGGDGRRGTATASVVGQAADTVTQALDNVDQIANQVAAAVIDALRVEKPALAVVDNVPVKPLPSGAISRPLPDVSGGDTINITINADIQDRDDWQAIARTVADEIKRRR